MIFVWVFANPKQGNIKKNTVFLQVFANWHLARDDSRAPSQSKGAHGRPMCEEFGPHSFAEDDADSRRLPKQGNIKKTIVLL